MTSSPTSSSTLRPCSFHACTAQPSARHCSSPSYTGSNGQPATNAVHTSVPPLVENSHTSLFTCSYTQRKLSGDIGEPVAPIARSAIKSKSRAGSIPAFSQLANRPGLTPMQVIRVRSASSHSTFRSGCAGLPSYNTIAASDNRQPTRKFHIIQPVVVNQNMRSPWRRSRCIRFFSCSIRMPPWLCTIALGRPVVPDEYSTHRGWSNGSCSKLSSAPSPWESSSCQMVSLEDLDELESASASLLVRSGLAG